MVRLSMYDGHYIPRAPPLERSTHSNLKDKPVEYSQSANYSIIPSKEYLAWYEVLITFALFTFSVTATITGCNYIHAI
jgi:hypothetical protein